MYLQMLIVSIVLLLVVMSLLRNPDRPIRIFNPLKFMWALITHVYTKLFKNEEDENISFSKKEARAQNHWKLWLLWSVACLIGAIWWYPKIAWGLVFPLCWILLIDPEKENKEMN
jgi:hypothetical protein